MNIVLWVLQILLALVFGGAGALKATQPRAKLLENPNLGWIEDVPWPLVRFVAVCEVLGAIGLILPAATGVLPWLTPLAASGLAVVMVGAIVLHARRSERQPIVLNTVLLVLSLVVAWGRFGPYPS